MQPPSVARVGDMQSVTLHREESIVVNKLAVTFRPRRGGRICFFHGSSQFLKDLLPQSGRPPFRAEVSRRSDMATVKLTLNNAPHSTLNRADPC